MTLLIDLTYEEIEIRYIAGDFIRFRATILQRDPDDPGTDEAPNKIPFPLDDYVLSSQVRKDLKKDSPLLATIEVEMDEDASHKMWVYLSGEQSALLRGLSSGRWDVQITDEAGDPLTILGGPIKPKGDTTRE